MSRLSRHVDKEEIIENYGRLTDGDCDELCALIRAGTVNKIAMAHNDIADEGAKKIAEVMKTNTTVKFLSLAANKIGEEGCLAFCDVLKENTTLETLFLIDNKGLTVEAKKTIREVNAARATPIPENLKGLTIAQKPFCAAGLGEKRAAEANKRLADENKL